MAKAINIVREAVEKIDKEYIVLEEPAPPWEDLIYSYPEIKFVIYKYSKDRWCSKSVRIKKDSFEMKKLFPEKWSDLTDEKLAKITGVKDAVFCHKARFIVCAKSKEGTIKLTELALKD